MKWNFIEKGIKELRRVCILCIGILVLVSFCSCQELAFADTYMEDLNNKDSFYRWQLSHLERVDEETTKMILEEVGLEEENLSDEERVALLTRGSTTVWDKTYKNEYNIKKSFSMTANLVSTGTKPYTTFTIKNTGSRKITVNVYKGEILGSTTIYETEIASGATKTFEVTRNHILKYGRVGNTGTTQVLTYNVSLYNENGKQISFDVEATREN